MSKAHHQHHTDVWLNHVSEQSDVPGTTRPHFENEELGFFSNLQHRERSSHFIVEGVSGVNGGTDLSTHCSYKIFGRGFSVRAGDSNYLQVAR